MRSSVKSIDDVNTAPQNKSGSQMRSSLKSSNEVNTASQKVVTGDDSQQGLKQVNNAMILQAKNA